jgi:hypothetical protein
LKTNWTDEQVAAYLARFNNSPVPSANVERDSKHAAQAKNARQKMGERVRIHYHSKRRRPIDPDGLYSKAAIDGLTEGGLLLDDKPEYVESITYSQEQSDEEETIITIEAFEVDAPHGPKAKLGGKPDG